MIATSIVQSAAAIISAIASLLTVAAAIWIIWYGFKHNAKLDEVARLVRALHSGNEFPPEYDIGGPR